MNILIVGAGRIGYAIAESLVSEANDITIVDHNAEHIAYLQSHYDLRGIVGDALNPAVLTDAGANDADMLVAVTSSDETNLALCLLAARIFNIPSRIARVRNNRFSDYPRILGEEGFQATSVIWPERALTDYLVRLIDFPEALQVQDFGDGVANLLAVRASAGSPLVGRPVSDLQTHLPNVQARIVALFRRNRRLDMQAATIVEAGDEVITLCESKYAREVMTELRRHEKPFTNIVLAGNSKLAFTIASELADGSQLHRSRGFNIRIVEADKTRAMQLAQKVPSNTIVIEGRYTDEDALTAADIETCDLFIALAESDETNVLASMLAKKLGARRAIAIVNSRAYGDMLQGSQIDITISLAASALGEVIKHVRHGDVAAAYSLRRGAAEALEIVAHGDKRTSKVVGRKIRDIDLPEGATIGALIRGEDDDAVVLMGTPETVVETEDHVVVFVSSKRLIPKIERLFAVDVGFF